MRKFSIILLSVVSALALTLNTGGVTTEHAITKSILVQYELEPGGH